ncbi:Positive regulator of CheA protein activity (CheW) [Rhodovulum sp. P5]|uniref:chemotaxis protein CheW n=1 Tax=Rhodovulum sp. P5 TaxID=1564506 RepID=UPI0009C21396|nr:chemotaxis protein CheW [Rhodovulum sp. P5]ARE40333.1 Positive regulator of CheA protein activity (CheW) [Rhodovulum sp. P5]
MARNTADVGDAVSDSEATAAEPRQFVTFYMGEDCFALPMELVREIIRVPDAIRVPLTPPGFEGLANLRGAILPVMDLRRMTGLPPRPVDDASRTIVVDCGTPVGLIVDRVSHVVSFAADRIETPEESASLGATGIDTLLDGVVKDTEGAGLIQILDVSQAVRLASVVAAESTTDAKPGLAGSTASQDADGEDDSLVQLVNLMVDGQEYAFEISEVDEIVRPPESIFQVPQSASHVLGLIDLRERLLPIVCLRRLFGLPSSEISESNRILVLHVDREGDPDARVGLVVDQVREVITASREDQVGVSSLISQTGQDRIGTMCRLEGGKRLIGVLSGRTLFQDAAIRAALDEAGETTETAEDQTDMAETTAQAAGDGDETQLVVYQLDGQDYGVEIDAVREIIRVPNDLRSVPRAPHYVAGIITLRGAVLPVVTMRTRFGLPEAEREDRQRIIVLSRDGVETGFIVDSVTEVLRLSRASIEKAPDLSDEQRALMGNVANLDGGDKIIQILDASALLLTETCDVRDEDEDLAATA